MERCLHLLKLNQSSDDCFVFVGWFVCCRTELDEKHPVVESSRRDPGLIRVGSEPMNTQSLAR